MTEKHKLKKRVRARMEVEGTSYSQALEVERGTNVNSPAWSTLASIQAHGGNLTDVVLDEQRTLRGSSAEIVDGFVERVCALAREIHATDESKWTRESCLWRLAAAAVGIDNFWLWDLDSICEERMHLGARLWTNLEAGASPESLREIVASAVHKGIEAPDLVKPEPRSLDLSSADDALVSLWEVAPDVSSVFWNKPKMYVHRDPPVEGWDRDARVVATLTVPSHFDVNSTVDGLPSRFDGLKVFEDDRARWQQRWEDSLSRFVLDMTEKVMRCVARDDRRGVAECLLSVEDTKHPSLSLVLDVFNKLDEGIPEGDLRQHLAASIEPRARALHVAGIRPIPW